VCLHIKNNFRIQCQWIFADFSNYCMSPKSKILQKVYVDPLVELHFCPVRHTPEHFHRNRYTHTAYTTEKSTHENLGLPRNRIFTKISLVTEKLFLKISWRTGHFASIDQKTEPCSWKCELRNFRGWVWIRKVGASIWAIDSEDRLRHELSPPRQTRRTYRNLALSKKWPLQMRSFLLDHMVWGLGACFIK